MRPLRTIIVVLALIALHSSPALADWGAYGAAVSCDQDLQRFAIMSDIDSSDGYIGGYEAESERFVERLDGGEHKLRCKLGKVTVSVTVTVSEPNTHMCQGAGHSWFSDVEVDGQPLVLDLAPSDGGKYPLDGTYACDQSPGLAAIKVIFEPELVTVCLSPSGDWKVDAQKLKCRAAALRANNSLERTRGR